MIVLSLMRLLYFYSVLDLDAFERNTKAEGLGVGLEGAAGEKNMHDAEFTCTLFRFIQLTCEGHNLGMYILHAKPLRILLFPQVTFFIEMVQPFFTKTSA